MKLKQIISSILSVSLVSVCVNFSLATAGAEAPAKPVLHYDFDGHTKENTSQYTVSNSEKADYDLFIDCSATNKSTFGKINDYTTSDGRQALNFQDRAYMEIKNGSSYVRDLLDGAFTFEVWVNIKDATALNKGGVPALLNVGDASTYNLRVELNNSGEKMLLRFDRTFVSGSGMKMQTEAVIDYGVWNHIFITYDPSSSANLPIICVNGVEQKTSSFSTTVLSSDDTPRMSTAYTGFRTHIGSAGAAGYSSGIFHSSFADIKLYNRLLTESDALAGYNASKDSFMGSYKLTGIENNSESVTPSGTLSLEEGEIIFNYDLTDIKADNVNSTNIKVLDKDGKDKGFTVELAGTAGKISKKYLEAGEYTLIFDKSIKDINGKIFRGTGYEIPFSVTENAALREQLVGEINSLMEDEAITDEALGEKLIADYNYILNIDVSEDSAYSKIIDKAGVFGFLRKTKYTLLSEIQTAFQKAVEDQAAQDTLDAVAAIRTAAALTDGTMVSEINKALFTTYAAIFKLDLTEYNKLTDKDKAIENMKGFKGTLVEDVVKCFNDGVEMAQKQERTDKAFDELEISIAQGKTDDVLSVLTAYNDVLELDLENEEYKKYSVKVAERIIADNANSPEMLNTVFGETLLLSAINDVEQGDRGRILELLDKYIASWTVPAGYKDLTHEERTDLAIELNGITFADIKTLSDKIDDVIAGDSEGTGESSETSIPSPKPSTDSKKDSYTTPSASESAPVPPSPLTPNLPFEDIEAFGWAHEGIEYLYKNNIVNGKSEKNYAPGAAVTREELAKMAALAFGFNADGANEGFDDVSENDWSYSYIVALNKEEIIKGITENIFGKKNAMKRCDLAVILVRIAEKKGIELKTGMLKFDDAADIPDYAKDAVAKMQASGIMNGVGENTFNPGGTVNRAAAAKTIFALISAQN